MEQGATLKKQNKKRPDISPLDDTRLVEDIDRKSKTFAAYFHGAEIGRSAAIFYSVSKDTIRAYHHTETFRPLSIYRSWANEELDYDFFKRLETASESVDKYRLFHKDLCKRLQKYWAKQEANAEARGDHGHPRSVPNYGRVRKLIDLLMKHVLFIEGIDPDVRSALKKVVHVPLDLYTLAHLSGVSESVGVKIRPVDWTMGFAKEENYNKLQNLVMRIAKDAKIDPIDFDVYAWNATKKMVKGPEPLDVDPAVFVLQRKRKGQNKLSGSQFHYAKLAMERQRAASVLPTSP